MLVKGINTLRRRFEAQKEAAPPPGPTPTEVLLGEIRDELKKQRK